MLRDLGSVKCDTYEIHHRVQPEEPKQERKGTLKSFENLGLVLFLLQNIVEASLSGSNIQPKRCFDSTLKGGGSISNPFSLHGSRCQTPKSDIHAG